MCRTHAKKTHDHACFTRQVNDRAKVSVKLVAEAGIGVVASGVAKANADIIQVRGAFVVLRALLVGCST